MEPTAAPPNPMARALHGTIGSGGFMSWWRRWPTLKPLEGRAAAGGCAVGSVHTLFVFCVVKSGKCAINGITTKPGHVGDRRKGVLNGRTSVALY
jgi:hypothetical protein